MLLHTCCGPCSTYTFHYWQDKGVPLTAFFYNPNIHPYQEYKRRRDTLVEYAGQQGIPVIVADDYDLEEFLARVAPHPSERCGDCYRMRLERTAAKAKELGESEFSTTLLISPYQNRELLVRVGHDLAAQYGLKFLDDDLRGGYRQSVEMSKENDLYRQPYCGCIYSEKDRYHKPPKGGKK